MTTCAKRTDEYLLKDTMKITVCALQVKIMRNLIKDFLLFFFFNVKHLENFAFNKVVRLGRVKSLKITLVSV